MTAWQVNWSLKKKKKTEHKLNIMSVRITSEKQQITPNIKYFNVRWLHKL